MALALSEDRKRTGQRAPGKYGRMVSWERYGLLPQRFLRSRTAEPRYSALPRPSLFREALEEEGGLFPLYGRFLAGRADLLPGPYLQQLQKIRPQGEPSLAPFVKDLLPSPVSNLHLVRMAPGREVYSARWREQAVVVEACGPQTAVPGADWDAFRQALRLLAEEPEGPVAGESVLDQFHGWLQVQADLERRRSLLANLQEVPSGCAIRFPRLIPELQSSSCIVYEDVAGEPLEAGLASASPAALGNLLLLAQGILELALLLSLIDTDGGFEEWRLLPEGGLGFRSLPSFVSVPVEWHHELLQYVTATVLADSRRALHTLAKMAFPENGAAESRLIQEMSALQPELKVSRWTPPAVALFENHWRALAATGPGVPLFLPLFHRSVSLLGPLNETVAPSRDLLEEALWPVMGGVLRFRMGEIFTLEKGREWAASSALLLLTAGRQAAGVLERIRDEEHDLAGLLARKESGSRAARRDRRTALLIQSLMALVVFLVSAGAALGSDGGPWEFFEAALSAVSAILLCIFVSRIE